MSSIFTVKGNDSDFSLLSGFRLVLPSASYLLCLAPLSFLVAFPPPKLVCLSLQAKRTEGQI